jgi:chromate transport protein ChrA
MSEPEAPKPEVTTPAPPDPWKGLRGVMAGALVLEAITVLLALPVVADIAGGVTWVSGTYLVVLALVMIAGAGLQRRSWAVPFNLGLQVLVLIGGVFHLSIAVIGVIFLAVWAFILLLRSDVKRRMDEGTLPSQRMSGGS